MPAAAGLYYFAHGAEAFTRPPVILIHGAGGHHLYWPPQVRRYPNERIFAVDLPGHGKSPNVGQHTIQDYAGEIVAFLETLKLGRAVLVGHSMGGAVALQAAIAAPDHILGLALLGSAARLRVSPALLHSASDPSKAADTVSMIMENSFAEGTAAGLKELAAQRMLEIRPSVLYGDLLACEAYDPGEGIAEIAAPTLILFGREDHMVPVGAGRLLQQNMQHARMDVLDGAGHMLMLEQPERVAASLNEFVQGLRYLPGE